MISPDNVAAYRARTFRLLRPVQNIDDALDFVQARGFIYFWPIKDVTFPSLWAAVAGNRPVASAHDDPGHVTWGWKDELLGTKTWYYAKVLRGKATIIALNVAPFFYALSENYGEPESDYLELYRDGLMSREAKIIFEALLRNGPLNTIRLRRATQMTSKGSKSAFERGLTQLQRDFKILPVGVAEAGAWRYSFVYDCVHRHYPWLPERARPIKRSEARRNLCRYYFAAVGAATAAEVRKLFQWRPRALARTLEAMQAEGELRSLPGDTPSQTQYVWHAFDDHG